jgi:hypothetical protein
LAEHLGKGEVDSSILSGSTISPLISTQNQAGTRATIRLKSGTVCSRDVPGPETQKARRPG